MRWLLALLVMSMSGELRAAALGLPENTARIGYAVGMSRLIVDDPAGSTKAAVSVRPLTLIYTDWLQSGGLRYWIEGYYASATLDAGANEVGQDVSRAGARVVLQRNIPLGSWSPWLGLGLDVSRNRYSKRHTEDRDGFLLAAYPDRSKTGVGIVVHAVSEKTNTPTWDVLGLLLQVCAKCGDVKKTTKSIGVLFRY